MPLCNMLCPNTKFMTLPTNLGATLSNLKVGAPRTFFVQASVGF